MHFVDGKWTLNTDPPTGGAWFSTASPSVINCALEDITLIRQGANNIIDTPLGKANDLGSENRSNSTLDYILRSQNNLAAHLQFVRRINITFKTETIQCGPQPRYNNFTIATNGWELATYRECYWRKKYVNFHGKHHVYRNGTWMKAEVTLIQPERNWPTTFRYDDGNSYEYEPQANPAYDNLAGSHVDFVADIAATMAEQNINDNGGSYPIRTIILTPKEKPDISNYVTWWETIKIATVADGRLKKIPGRNLTGRGVMKRKLA
ncbi:hypothetical protein OUZ56_032877 [Daphnia magna]|uniref:Uncharacterized protein n=1 Tax=Daphnia magna TaxID=35525 RepID=A0ABR0B9R8_9CRUS|nr:hypothetical protein OUZ56_032877 [Daphnia magna]